jgi:hypothetical protein
MQKFLNTMLGSWLKMFVAIILYEFWQMGADLFSLNAESLKALLQAGLVGLIPVIINWLNPKDERYGWKG